MKAYLWSALIVLLHLGSFNVAFSQQVELVYRERESSVGQTPLVLMHKSSSQLFLALNRVGAFTLNGPSLQPVPIEDVQDADGFESNFYCECANSDFLLHQYGFLGNRLFRLDSQGIAHRIPVAKGEITSVHLRDNGTAVCEVKDSIGQYTQYVTLDCGNTWFSERGFPSLAMNGAVLLESTGPVRMKIARAGLGNQSYPSAIKAKNGLHSCALLGRDSVVWIATSGRAALPDTIWYADIRDSSMKRFDTVLRAVGISDTIKLTDVKLLATNSGNSFLFHRSGWYARYKASRWTVVDTLPRIETMNFTSASNTSVSDNVLRYISTYQTGQQLVTVVLDSVDRPYSSVTLDPSPIDLRGMNVVSSDYTALFWRSTTTPVCLYSDVGGMQVINSVIKNIDVLPVTPIQFGFTNDAGEPTVVPYSDCAVLVTESGVGLLKAARKRGEYWLETGNHGPRLQASRGLRTPFIGTDEVISPGDKVRQYTRDGNLVRTLSPKPATTVFRMEDSTLLIANQTTIYVMRAGGDTDSVDITPVVCTTADTAGYVNSITNASDGSLIAYVNGLRLLDLETLGSKPWRCGGVLRSQDAGRTWKRSTNPIESPYFLGSVRTSSGVIIASVSTVVRDTTLQISEDQAPLVESKNHTFNDRFVVRSADNGVTWTQVHTSPSSNPFRLVGGDGVITKNGTLLLMTTDGVLQSTNDGIDWDFHEVFGMDAGAQIISMFQDTAGSSVYYCTTDGLYKEQPVTDVYEDRRAPHFEIRAARRWRDHESYWKQSGIEIKRLFSILGVEVPLINPQAGLYLVECEFQSMIKVEPILVLAE